MYVIFISRALKVTQDGSHVKIEFKNQSDRIYKSVICADGIHSIGKEAIFPANSFEKPDHSGTELRQYYTKYYTEYYTRFPNTQ